MPDFKATHTGQLHGDARTGDRKPVVLLHETAKYWIDKHGVKYRKSTGWPTGGDSWPLWTLAVETVRPICTTPTTTSDTLKSPS